MTKAFVCACLAAAVLAACAGGNGVKPSPTPALRNPLDFPLYNGAALVSAKAFTQSVRARASTQPVFAQGNGIYAGHEVIAASNADFATLTAWLDGLNAAPPAGYTALEPQSNPQQEEQAQNDGIDYALFKRKTGKTTHEVLVLVLDPQQVDKRFGTILRMAARYRALPAVLRAPIDNEAKARYGISISQATEPDSPIGAALGALGELQKKGARGIVILDAQKV
jgi:hypothetical protein